MEVSNINSAIQINFNSIPRQARAMPSSSATGSPRLGAQECVDDCLEDVAVVHAAAAEDETGGTAALSGAERYRAGLRASSTTTWAVCPREEARPHRVVGGPACRAWKTNGNGGCAYHAVWGVPVLGSDGSVELYRAGVRHLVLRSLPVEFADLEARVPVFIRAMLQNWFRAAYDDAVNVDNGDREGRYFREHLPEDVRDDAVAYAVQTKGAERAVISAVDDFERFAESFFTEANERAFVRPLAEILGYINPGDDRDILSLSPDDARCAFLEGDGCDFEILHRASGRPGLTKYAALFQKDKTYWSRFFLVEDPDARHYVRDALDQLSSQSNSAEARALLGTAAPTLRALYDAKSGISARELPQSFTSEAAWCALRGALCEEGYWLSVMELQCLAACCGCRVTARMQYGGHGGEWVDHTLEREIVDLMGCSEEHAAEMTRVLEDRVHVYIPLGMRRGHFSRLSTEDEAQQLRERVEESRRSVETARREMAAMAAEDEASTRWRVAVERRMRRETAAMAAEGQAATPRRASKMSSASTVARKATMQTIAIPHTPHLRGSKSCVKLRKGASNSIQTNEEDQK